MPKRRNRDERNRKSYKIKRRQQRRPKLMVRVLPDDGSGRMRRIDPDDVRLYFTGAGWIGGVIDRRWITGLFPDGSGGVMDWRDVPIHHDGIYVRSEEGVFRLVKIRSLREVVKKVGGDLLRPHQSVLINKDWIHDYSPKRGEIGVLVNGSDGKSRCERVQVSLRKKGFVDRQLLDTEDPEDS
jgi:hypothetical protein